MPKHDVAESRGSGKWTRPDAYIESLLRARGARKSNAAPPRTEPEAPRLLLSTIPFFAIMAALMVLAAAIMLAAWPGNQPAIKQRVEPAEQGVAAKGWLEKAERDFHK